MRESQECQMDTRTYSNAKELVSVIVPVYNVEKYLRRCIDSLLNQTYRNLEIILVDDGSGDLSGLICDEYEKKDARIKVIHKANGGVSSARNAGLDRMTGSYVTFIDSDDYVLPDYVEKLMNVMLKYHAHMAGCHTWSEGSPAACTGENAVPIQITKDNFLDFQWHASVNATCFRAEVIREAKVRFDEAIAFGEDTLVLFEVFSQYPNAYLLRDQLYFYDKSTGGVTSQPVSEKNLHLLEAYERIFRRIPGKEKTMHSKCGWISAELAFSILVRYQGEQALLNRPKQSLLHWDKIEKTTVHVMRKNVWYYLTGKKEKNRKLKAVYLMICLLGRFYFRIHRTACNRPGDGSRFY